MCPNFCHLGYTPTFLELGRILCSLLVLPQPLLRPRQLLMVMLEMLKILQQWVSQQLPKALMRPPPRLQS